MTEMTVIELLADRSPPSKQEFDLANFRFIVADPL